MKLDSNLNFYDQDKDKIDNSKEKMDVKREVFQWVQSLILCVVLVALAFTFIGRISPVSGISMEPTFHDGEKIITTSLYGKLKYGDVVAIRRKDGLPLIKRVIAIEGDTIEIDANTAEVKVNGVVLKEPYIKEPTYVDLGMKGPATVPKGHVFAMGDNRNHSDDSRDARIGMIDERNVFGKVIFRFYPFNKMGTIKLNASE